MSAYHWLWFVISQMGFGIVAGIVVSRTQKIPTSQRMPFALEHGNARNHGRAA